MNPHDLLSSLRKRGVHVDVNSQSGNLLLRAREGVLTPDVGEMVKAHKEALLELLTVEGVDENAGKFGQRPDKMPQATRRAATPEQLRLDAERGRILSVFPEATQPERGTWRINGVHYDHDEALLLAIPVTSITRDSHQREFDVGAAYNSATARAHARELSAATVDSFPSIPLAQLLERPLFQCLSALIQGAADGTLPEARVVVDDADPLEVCTFVLHVASEIEALICNPENEKEAEDFKCATTRFDHLIRQLRDIDRWRELCLALPQDCHGSEEDRDPFADDPSEQERNPPDPRIAAAEAHVNRIRQAMRCDNPQCPCHIDRHHVHCPICEKVSLSVCMGMGLEVSVSCCKLRRQRRSPCPDVEVWAALEERGLWDASCTEAVRRVHVRKWIGPGQPSIQTSDRA